MTLRCIVYMSIFMIVFMMFPARWGMDAPCDWSCYQSKIPCIHAQERFGFLPGFEMATAMHKTIIQWLKEAPGSYQFANLIAYFGILPTLAIFTGWLNKDKWYWFVGSIGSTFFMLGIAQLSWNGSWATSMNWYHYCVDFCIRIGNLLGLTYHGLCFLLFVVAINGVILLDMTRGFYKRVYGSRNVDITKEASADSIS